MRLHLFALNPAPFIIRHWLRQREKPVRESLGWDLDIGVETSWDCLFMDRGNRVEVHKLTKGKSDVNTRPFLTEQTWSINDLLHEKKEHWFYSGTQRVSLFQGLGQYSGNDRKLKRARDESGLDPAHPAPAFSIITDRDRSRWSVQCTVLGTDDQRKGQLITVRDR